MSQEDIASGSRWSSEIAQELQTSSFGIICINPANQSNPWIQFEAGALSRTVAKSSVCPYFQDMSATDIIGPLAQFQSSSADREGTRKMLHSINRALESNALDPDELGEIYDVWWPKLEAKLAERVPQENPHADTRTLEDMIKELLDNSREHLRREDVRFKRASTIDEKMDKMTALMGSQFEELSDSKKAMASVFGLKDGEPQNSSIDPSKLLAELIEFQGMSKEFTTELLRKPVAPPNPEQEA